VSAGRHSLAPDGIHIAPAIPPSSDARSLCEKPFFLEQQFLQVAAVSFEFTPGEEKRWRFSAILKQNYALRRFNTEQFSDFHEARRSLKANAGSKTLFWQLTLDCLVSRQLTRGLNLRIISTQCLQGIS